MKSVALHFSLFFSMLVIASCDSGDNVNDPKIVSTSLNENIVGNWRLTGIQTTGMQPTSAPFLPVYTELYEFKADNTFSLKRSNGIEYKGTYTKTRLGEEDYIEGTFENPELLKDETFLTFCTFTPGKVFLWAASTAGNAELVSSCAAADGNIFTYNKVIAVD